MTGYRESLAFTHDAGFTELATLAADRLLEEINRGEDEERGLVVELGCGPGVTAARLTSAGFDVLGIDVSPAMLALARARAPRATFIEGSWVTAEIPPCDAVIAVGEVFNYQFDKAANLKAIERTFGRIFKALWPGGVFLFDVAGPGRIPGGGPERAVHLGDDWAVIVETTEDAKKDSLTRAMTILRKQEGAITTDEEVHRQRLIPASKVLDLLRKAGFKARSLQGYDGNRFAPGHAVFLARRP